MSQISPSGTATPAQWPLRPTYGSRTVAVLLIAAVLLAWSAHRTEVPRMLAMSARALADAVGVIDDSGVGRGWERFADSAFPLVFAERTAVSRLEDFDPANLPLGARIEQQPVYEYDLAQQARVQTGTVAVLVEPLGYLWRVLRLMVSTLEIAVWGTILAVVLASPLAYLGASGYTPHAAVRWAARGVCSFFRAIPELVSALFLLLMFGAGTIPGILALGVHCAGFLGKFYADDIENTDRGPQEALAAVGSGRLKVMRYAVLPQVMPQFLAYTQYIFERNVRTATVLGIVGAGGIGVELIGRWSMNDYGHVATILLVIFITVYIIEHLTQHVRARLIG